MSSAFQPPSPFVALPVELKHGILRKLDYRSLLRVSQTSTDMLAVVRDCEEISLIIEAGRSHLQPTGQPFDSTAASKKYLEAHRRFRLLFRPDLAPSITFTSSKPGVFTQRLFREYFMCITADNTLLLWNTRTQASFDSPYLTLQGMKIVDAVMDPKRQMLILMCLDSLTETRISFYKLTEVANTPVATFKFAIQHQTLPGDIIVVVPQLITHLENLIALVYYQDDTQTRRRGLIWDIRTQTIIYDSQDTIYPAGFRDLLLLPAPGCFAVSTIRSEGLPAAHSGCIELRSIVRKANSSPRSGLNVFGSNLIAVLHLPELEDPSKIFATRLDFNSSEPRYGRLARSKDGTELPFISRPDLGVHVLYIRYEPISGTDEEKRNLALDYHLVISNQAFDSVLTKWARHTQKRLNGRTDTPLYPFESMPWRSWGPWLTSLARAERQGPLSKTSSVSGSRVCSASRSGRKNDPYVQIDVRDYNMNFPCPERRCNPSSHFAGTLFPPASSNHPETTPTNYWKDWVSTNLASHYMSCVQIFREDMHKGRRINSLPNVLMDEELMVLWNEPLTNEPDIRTWTILYVLQEPQLEPNEDVAMADPNALGPVITITRDSICRLCRTAPHSDVHILLECAGHPKVVELRESQFLRGLHVRDPEIHQLWLRGDTARILDEAMHRPNHPIRMFLWLLAVQIQDIYYNAESCGDIVEIGKDDSLSKIFVQRKSDLEDFDMEDLDMDSDSDSDSD